MRAGTEPPREAAVEISGHRAAYLSWGSPDGPLMLLQHGFPDTAWTWRHVAPRFADQGWRVVAPFSRGYAPTDLASDGNYQLGALVRDIVDLHTASGGDDRAVLVGHDWGALTAYGVGALEESPFAKVVAMSFPPYATLRRAYRARGALSRGLRQLRCSWYVIFNQVPLVPESIFTWLIRRLWADWSPTFDASADIEHVLRALPDRAHRTAAIGYYRAFARPWLRSPAFAREQDASKRVPSAPTLYVHGTCDGASLAEAAVDTEADLVTGSRVRMVEGAGHFPQLERPDVVAAEVLDFVGPAPAQ